MEMSVLFRAIFALLLVIGLIGLIAALARKFGLEKRLTGIGAKSNRLSVSDAVTVDPRHRLVLVRRDDKEHLLLLGTNGDLVIETGIPASESKDESRSDREPTAHA